MAIIKQFERVAKDGSGRATFAEGGYYVTTIDGVEYLVLESYGSPARKLIGKPSQVFHLDREAAVQLKSLLESTFEGL